MRKTAQTLPNPAGTARSLLHGGAFGTILSTALTAGLGPALKLASPAAARLALGLQTPANIGRYAAGGAVPQIVQMMAGQ
jgi:hypothetical protein